MKAAVKDPILLPTILLFLGLTLWRVLIPFFPQPIDPEAHDALFYWATFYQVMALWGAVWGITIARHWGGFRSIVGRALVAFSVGLFLQSFGQAVYTYYIYSGVEIPYPSLGDVGFFGSIPCYIYGILLLSRASGAVISLRSYRNQIQAMLIPVVLLLISYFFFLKEYQLDLSAPLTTLLDFGYPVGQALYVSLAVLTYLLSRKFLGGVMRVPLLFFIFALVSQYLSDFLFLYQAKQGTYTGGNIVDYMYLTSYFLMAVSLIQMRVVYKKIRAN